MRQGAVQPLCGHNTVLAGCLLFPPPHAERWLPVPLLWHPPTGDLNWHYHEPMPLPPGWVDVWPLLMPHNSGHTWSSLARTGKATGPVSSLVSCCYKGVGGWGSEAKQLVHPVCETS